MTEFHVLSIPRITFDSKNPVYDNTKTNDWLKQHPEFEPYGNLYINP